MVYRSVFENLFCDLHALSRAVYLFVCSQQKSKKRYEGEEVWKEKNWDPGWDLFCCQPDVPSELETYGGFHSWREIPEAVFLY